MPTQQKTPLQCRATNSSPLSLQLEKAHAQQRRPSSQVKIKDVNLVLSSHLSFSKGSPATLKLINKLKAYKYYSGTFPGLTLGGY